MLAYRRGRGYDGGMKSFVLLSCLLVPLAVAAPAGAQDAVLGPRQMEPGMERYLQEHPELQAESGRMAGEVRELVAPRASRPAGDTKEQVVEGLLQLGGRALMGYLEHKEAEEARERQWEQRAPRAQAAPSAVPPLREMPAMPAEDGAAPVAAPAPEPVPTAPAAPADAPAPAAVPVPAAVAAPTPPPPAEAAERDWTDRGSEMLGAFASRAAAEMRNEPLGRMLGNALKDALDVLLDEYKEQYKAEGRAYAKELGDKMVERVREDPEISSSISALKLLCWGVIGYLTLVTLVMLGCLLHLRRTNARLLAEVRRMAGEKG